jgi:hypothetical protein
MRDKLPGGFADVVRAEQVAKRLGVCTHGSVVPGDSPGSWVCVGCGMTFATESAQHDARWAALESYL